MSCVEGRLSAADLARGHVHLEARVPQEALRVCDRFGEDEVAKARDEELDAGHREKVTGREKRDGGASRRLRHPFWIGAPPASAGERSDLVFATW